MSRYLNVSERIACDRLTKTVKASVLMSELESKTRREVVGMTTAFTLMVEATEYGAALEILDRLETGVDEGLPYSDQVKQRIEHARKTINPTKSGGQR